MKISKLLTLLALMIPASVIAEESDPGFYLGLGVGISQFEDNIPDVDKQVDTLEAGYRLFAGYFFNDNWSTELGYADYGSDVGYYAGGEVPIKYEAIGLYLNGYYHWVFLRDLPAANKLSLDLMLGVQRAEGKSQLYPPANYPEIFQCVPGSAIEQFCQNTDKNWGLSAGLGATWQITKHIGLKAMFEATSLKFDDNTSADGVVEEQFKIPYRFNIDAYWRF